MSNQDSTDVGRRRASAVIRRQRVLLIITSVALVVCVAGLVAARFVKSPAQQAAEQGPPSPSVITAAVVSQTLTQQITVRGSVVVADSVTVTCRQQVSPAILTRLAVAVGDTVAEGQQLAEVSGEPIFLMTGVIPEYRTMAVGDKGTDVAQLQAGLQRLGLLAAAPTGTYDKATGSAVAALFKNAGYADPGQAPLGTIVFVPSLPAVVGSVGAQVRDEVGGQALLTILTGNPVVQATIPAGQQNGIAVGQAVTISDEANQRNGGGTVASLGAFTAQQIDANGVALAGSLPGYPVVVTVTDGIDATWVGASVAVTIVSAATPEPVLAVPLVAVQTASDGHSFVLVNAAGSTHEVAVTTGLVAAGLVEVTPTSTNALKAGDQVVVG